MILIADSGGSGTSWCLINEGRPVFFRSGGLHPDTINSAMDIPGQLKGFASTVERVVFYGTGCARAEKAQKIESLLATWFSGAQIKVYSDLMALAHAFWGKAPGLVGVLGTGASMAWYNGENIEFSVISKGKYSDPGGGARIGEILRNLYQKKQTPDDLSEKIKLMVASELEITDHHFTQFVMQNLEHPFLASIVENEIIGYFEYYMPTWKRHQAGLVLCGTIAWLGRNIINQVAKCYKVKIYQIIREPIYPLATYYKSSSNSSSI